MVQKKSVHSDEVTDRPTTIRVRGNVARSVLAFFLHNDNPDGFPVSTIAKILSLQYDAVKTALRRLCKGALVTHLGRRYMMASDRRADAQRVYDAEGKKVPVCDEIGSLSQGALGWVPRASEQKAPKEIHINFHPWSEIVAWKEGWPENRTLPTIRFPPFIIHQLRLMATRIQGTSGGWVWVYGQHFKIRIASREALQIYLGEHNWKNEFKDWLTTVPNLTDSDLDMIWNKVAQACNHQRVTYEFHVPDAHFTAVRPDCFREDQSLRWPCSDVARVQLFPPTPSIAANSHQGRGGVCRAGLHQPSRTICRSGALRETILGTARGIAEGRQEGAEGRARSSPKGNQGFAVHHRQAPRGARTDTGTAESTGRCCLETAAAIEGGI